MLFDSGYESWNIFRIDQSMTLMPPKVRFFPVIELTDWNLAAHDSVRAPNQYQYVCKSKASTYKKLSKLASNQVQVNVKPFKTLLNFHPQTNSAEVKQTVVTAYSWHGKH